MQAGEKSFPLFPAVRCHETDRQPLTDDDRAEMSDCIGADIRQALDFPSTGRIL